MGKGEERPSPDLCNKAVPGGSPLLLNEVVEFTEIEWSPPAVQVRKPGTKVLDVAYMSDPSNRSFLTKIHYPKNRKAKCLCS